MVVLDSWALIAYLRQEPAAGRVRQAWVSGAVAICSVNLGEVLCAGVRRYGVERADAEIEGLRATLTVVEADWELIRAAARSKARGGLSYADAFCVATAQRLDAPLWTGDPEIVALSGEVDVVDLRAAA